MTHAKCVIYVKNDKNAIFGTYANRHMSCIDMAIGVSKDASGPQECRQMPFKQLVNKFNGSNFQNTDFRNFPLYFLKFPLYNVGTQWQVFQIS